MADLIPASNITVLVAEDDLDLRDAVVETLELSGYRVVSFAGAEQACTYLQDHDVDIIFSDVCMGDMDGHAFLAWVQKHKAYIPFILMTAFGTIERSVAAMRGGASDYLVKPYEPRVLIELVQRFVGGANDYEGFVVEDPRTRTLYELAEKVAGSDSTVMISGESGCGKEVLARFIHARSGRDKGPFVAINCAAIPETMLEATLFGHEKGAFTGAYAAAPGKFELANSGTLLLDEISEMDLGLQAKLLRVIQEREVERVGGRKTIPLDVRIIATTNRDLKSHVQAGKFREDLYYRLSVFPLSIPALRERRGDIPALAGFLLAEHGKRMNRSGVVLDRTASDKLINYQWPGNVRELDNVIQRALILTVGNQITVNELMLDGDFQTSIGSRELTADLQDPANTAYREDLAPSRPSQPPDLQKELNHHEVDQIQQALAQTRGSKKDAAELLGLSPRTLRYRMARLRDKGLLD